MVLVALMELGDGGRDTVEELGKGLPHIDVQLGQPSGDAFITRLELSLCRGVDALTGLIQDALPVVALRRVLGQELGKLVEFAGEFLELVLGRRCTLVLCLELP